MEFFPRFGIKSRLQKSEGRPRSLLAPIFLDDTGFKRVVLFKPIVIFYLKKSMFGFMPGQSCVVRHLSQAVNFDRLTAKIVA